MKPARRKIFRTSIEFVHDAPVKIEDIRLAPGSRIIKLTQEETLEVSDNRFRGLVHWLKKVGNLVFQQVVVVIGALVLAYLLIRLGLS